MSAVITEFAPAKINLALHVLGRRVDGYHELDSVVAFADVGDVLTFTPASETTLSVDGVFASGVPLTSDNLVLRAYSALAQLGALSPVAMHLMKNLPIASGIGGGSADAAAALRGLMRMFDLRFDSETMRELALSLGADVPVCIHGKACRMQGVGEIITPLEQLPAPAILLVNPLQACGTADVFRSMGLKAGDNAGLALDVNMPASWRNDMTDAAQRVLPVISEVLATLEALPSTRAVRMSGSGATCFALMDRHADAVLAAEQLKSAYESWWVEPARLS
jgi:4-diphosphocytidyl-2-C-methyl-D-erythritol kinase